MQIWRREFNDSQYFLDAINLAFGFLEHGLVPLRLIFTEDDNNIYPDSFRPFGLIFLAVGALHLAIVGVLLFGRRDRTWALRYRNRVLLVHFLARIVEYYILALGSQLPMVPQPLEIPDSWGKALAIHLFHPLIMARLSLGFIIPLELRHIVAATQLVIVAHQCPARCAAEITLVPGQASHYKEMMAGIEQMMFKWFPIPSFRGGAEDSLLAGQISGIGACILVKNWLQVRISKYSLTCSVLYDLTKIV